MKSRKFADSIKNAMGTVMLLAGAFFVCSTLLSIRSVMADPIAPVDSTVQMLSQSGRNGVNPRSGRASPRNRANATSRATVARTAVPVSTNDAVKSRSTVQSRATAARRANASRANATASTPTRNVVSRTNAVVNRANAKTNRAVRARTATTDAATNARISLQGSAIRGSKTTNTKTYSYLNSKLYTGNYSNIIDSTTGLISADAFNNCMESYYTCMDEICTARNAAQRRCACAGRVKAFAEAEAALETANEELIKVSGELALLVANKGKDISQAFQLTEAEQVMNCVSWQDMKDQMTISTDANENNIQDDVEWCRAHGIYDKSKCSKDVAPDYCSSNVNDFGFDIADLNGNGSDILASLKSWASAKDRTITILVNDNDDNIVSSFQNLTGVVENLTGIAGTLKSADDIKDTLAETWGYDLFAYAHNNVCARVLDSCFNGIYEACGKPVGEGVCGNGATQCPFNYNSRITVNNGTEEALEFVQPKSGYSVSNSATCFGYTTASGDPYANLRRPVADARRSIMQKYALDANADCDAYGEQLRATAQNIGYQKVAAQQALQQKRLEFAQEEEESILSASRTAMSNFNLCLSEIYECYVETEESEDNWTTSRIKTYCSQVANIPHCYEDMICMPSGAQFSAVIDVEDNASCANTQDYTTNKCRNVVTLNEILNGAYAGVLEEGYVPQWGASVNEDSTKVREYCLRNAMGIPMGGDAKGTGTDTWNIRNWKKEGADSGNNQPTGSGDAGDN